MKKSLPLVILNYLIRENKPKIANQIAKSIRKTAQSVHYQLVKMVEKGILLKEKEGKYRPQVYFLNENMYRLFYDEIERFIIFLRENTDNSQMEKDDIVAILHLFLKRFIQELQ